MRNKKYLIAIIIFVVVAILLIGLSLPANIFSFQAFKASSAVGKSPKKAQKLGLPGAANAAESTSSTVATASTVSTVSTGPTALAGETEGNANNGQNDKSTASSLNVSPLGQAPAANVIWALPPTERAVFITIDDGWYPNSAVLQIMQHYHLPITAFLIEQAAAEHPAYWREFVRAGGDVENHTFSHPNLTQSSLTGMEQQIKQPMAYFTALASRPVLFRPPYGDYNHTVCQVVYQAGIKHVIMWSAVMSNGVLKTYNDKQLQPGAIILLHWVPGVDAEVQKLMTILATDHLGVASLPVAIAHPGHFPVTMLPQNSGQKPGATTSQPSIKGGA
ncbi:MAG: polysaccharide deacetylase family protein [Peptococcaceae bacterium]|nr:polysaccharide deacetylase family protein [Peptococcaceae bacterium]